MTKSIRQYESGWHLICSVLPGLFREPGSTKLVLLTLSPVCRIGLISC